MANRKIMLPQYGTVMKRGVLYYRTRIKDTNGKLVAIYAKTPEELYNKETLALEQIENATFHRKTPRIRGNAVCGESRMHGVEWGKIWR